MGIALPGVGSKLPIDDIISELMKIEQVPLQSLDKKVASFEAKLSAIGTVKGALATFQTAVRGLSAIGKFQAMSATSADPAVASISATGSAAVGSHSLEVSQLAQAQKLATAGQASSSAAIGAGTIVFEMGTISAGSFDAATGKYTGASFAANGPDLKTVVIDPADSSLSGIRDAINQAKIGVSASIVNDGSGTPYRLVLTEASTGKTNSMRIAVTGDARLQALLNHDPASDAGQALAETVTAQNAQFKLDGIAISTSSNSASNVIDGVTLNLAKTNAGTPTTLTIGRDTASVEAAVGQFVSAYNAINKTLADLSAYDQSKKKGAALNGDATVRDIQTELRSMLTSPVKGGGTAFSMLGEIGVTVTKGIMAVDNAKLKEAIDSNFTDIASLFAAVGKPDNAQVTFKDATAKTVAGAYAVNVTRAATQASSTASAQAGLTIDSSNSTLQVQLNGVTATVTLAEGAYADAAALAVEVQSKINGAAAFAGGGSAVTVTESLGVLTITSNRYGAASSVSIAGGVGATNLMGATPADTAGVDVAGTIGGVAASGSGRTLTGAADSPAEGLALLIDGSGDLGTVTYSRGYASQFDQYVTELLGADSPLKLRSDGIDSSLKNLADNRLRLEDRLIATQARYRLQFSKLDAMIASMNATSSYLTQQLAALSNLK